MYSRHWKTRKPLRQRYTLLTHIHAHHHDACLPGAQLWLIRSGAQQLKTRSIIQTIPSRTATEQTMLTPQAQLLISLMSSSICEIRAGLHVTQPPTGSADLKLHMFSLSPGDRVHSSATLHLHAKAILSTYTPSELGR